MKIKNKIKNYLYDKEYKIIIKENAINIINYDEIVSFSLNNISVKYQDKIISIDGYNLTISKMVYDEVLITGEIVNVRINQK